MRRRRIRPVLSVLSLLLTVPVFALWARSLAVVDWLSHAHAVNVNGRYARTEWIILSAPGFISLTKADRLPIDDASASWLHDLDQRSGLGWSFGPVDSFAPSWESFLSGLSRFGFPSGADKQGRTNRVWKSFEVPNWVLLLVVSLPAQLAAVGLARGLRGRRRIGFPDRASRTVPPSVDRA